MSPIRPTGDSDHKQDTDPGRILRSLQAFQHKKHDVAVFHVMDDAEIDLPYEELSNFRDMESGQRLAVDPGSFRRTYTTRVGEFLRELREGCQRSNVDYHLVRTSQPIESVLGKYLAFRAGEEPVTFLSAAFLTALASVAIPIVIHLIHRQRYPDRNFPTLRFFDKTVKHNVVQRRLIDRILLALRVLALILLAIGLSRPFWHGPLGEKRMSLVIVLDNSPSMARPHDNKPLLERAKLAVASVLDQLGPADRVEILLTSPAGDTASVAGPELSRQLALRNGQPTALIVPGEKGAPISIPGMTDDSARLQNVLAKLPAGAPVSLATFDQNSSAQFGYDHARLRTLLDTVKVSSQPGDVRKAIATAGELLSRSSDGDRKIIVVSDLQAADWQGEAPGQLAGVDVKVVTIEPDSVPGTNLGIENCVVSQPMAGLGQQVAATFTLRNYGASASSQSTLHLTVGDRDLPSEPKVPPIPARSSMMVTVPIIASGRDHLLCSATLKNATDPFPYDNTWHFQIGVRPPVTALCVNGAAGATSSDKSTFFVMNALATHGGGAAASADARECEADDLKNQKLFQYAVVLLADVPVLDAQARTKLHQFVTDGGGVLVFANPSAAPSEYNDWGFLPARVTKQNKKSFVYVRSMAEKAAAVADVRQRAGSSVHALSTESSFTVEPTEGTTVLARFSNGDPALVESRIGKGRVIFVATSCHVSQSDWPLRPAFVLLVRNLVQYLGSAKSGPAVLPDRLVGDGAAMSIAPEHAGGTPALFHLASDSSGFTYQPLPWFRQGDRLVMPTAAEPGQYVLSVRPETTAGLLSEPGLGAETIPVSVNHNPSESDLTPARSDVIEKYFPGAKVSFETAAGDARVELSAGHDLWRLLLAGALIFLVVESFIAWRWASESSN